jgi:hypothetical protein
MTQVTIVFTATRHHSELLHAMLQHIHVSSTIVYGRFNIYAYWDFIPIPYTHM